MGIIASSNNWIDFANAVGDFNKAHRKDAVAQEYGLNSKIAPGMWLASHIQGMKKISGVKQIKFPEVVHEWDYFEITSTNGKPKERNYEFNCKDKKVCEITGVVFKDYDSPAGDLEDVLYEYKTDIKQNKINNYWKSIGHPKGNGKDLPNMYLASLFAPALLDFGEETGLTGFHATQNFQIHKDYFKGEVNFLIGDRKDRGPLSFLKLRGYQNGDMVISGRVGIAISDM